MLSNFMMINLSELKLVLQRTFIIAIDENADTIKINYLLSHLIATNSKPFAESRFIREYIMTLVRMLWRIQIKKMSTEN